jgi:hypothetical protein
LENSKHPTYVATDRGAIDLEQKAQHIGVQVQLQPHQRHQQPVAERQLVLPSAPDCALASTLAQAFPFLLAPHGDYLVVQFIKFLYGHAKEALEQARLATETLVGDFNAALRVCCGAVYQDLAIVQQLYYQSKGDKIWTYLLGSQFG